MRRSHSWRRPAASLSAFHRVDRLLRPRRRVQVRAGTLRDALGPRERAGQPAARHARAARSWLIALSNRDALRPTERRSIARRGRQVDATNDSRCVVSRGVGLGSEPGALCAPKCPTTQVLPPFRACCRGSHPRWLYGSLTRPRFCLRCGAPVPSGNNTKAHAAGAAAGARAATAATAASVTASAHRPRLPVSFEEMDFVMVRTCARVARPRWPRCVLLHRC